MMKDYMESIYDVLNSADEEFVDDGITYVGFPEDEDDLFYEDELAWADDITYLDEPEDDEFDFQDLGDDYIPLPQGDIIYEQPVVIDENYMLDEFETDIIDGYYVEEIEEKPAVEIKQRTESDGELEDILKFLSQEDVDLSLDLDKAESIIKLPEKQEVVEELKILGQNNDDDKISKAIAKEYMDMASSNVTNIASEEYGTEEDTSWVNGEDIFGNDISVIIAEDPNKEVEEEDFAEGSFNDWLAQQ